MMADDHDLDDLLGQHRDRQTAVREARAALTDAQADAARVRAAVRDRLLRLGLDDRDIGALVGDEALA